MLVRDAAVPIHAAAQSVAQHEVLCPLLVSSRSAGAGMRSAAAGAAVSDEQLLAQQREKQAGAAGGGSKDN